MLSWMTGDGSLQDLMAADPAVTAQFFSQPTSFITGSSPAAPGGWAVIPVKKYDSYAAYAADTDRSCQWVLYDPEKWMHTPVDEQRHPRHFLAAFAHLAHSRGQKVIETPARDLTGVKGGDFARRWGESTDHAYLRTGVAAACAQADVFECQAQGDQGSLKAYRYLVTQAKKQIPAGQVYWAGLTTDRPGNTAEQLTACYSAVAGIVDGFWLNTGGDGAAVAAQFLAGLPQ